MCVYTSAMFLAATSSKTYTYIPYIYIYIHRTTAVLLLTLQLLLPLLSRSSGSSAALVWCPIWLIGVSSPSRNACKTRVLQTSKSPRIYISSWITQTPILRCSRQPSLYTSSTIANACARFEWEQGRERKRQTTRGCGSASNYPTAKIYPIGSTNAIHICRRLLYGLFLFFARWIASYIIRPKEKERANEFKDSEAFMSSEGLLSNIEPCTTIL